MRVVTEETIYPGMKVVIAEESLFKDQQGDHLFGTVVTEMIPHNPNWWKVQFGDRTNGYRVGVIKSFSRGIIIDGKKYDLVEYEEQAKNKLSGLIIKP